MVKKVAPKKAVDKVVRTNMVINKTPNNQPEEGEIEEGEEEDEFE